MSEQERVRVWVGFAFEDDELKDFVVSGDLETAKSLVYHGLLDWTAPMGEPKWHEGRSGKHYLEIDDWHEERAFVQQAPLMKPEALFDYE